MSQASIPLINRLAEIGGNLQKLRWEAQDAGLPGLAGDIANAIEAIAWAAGIYTPSANVMDRPSVKSGQTMKVIVERPETQPRRNRAD